MMTIQEFKRSTEGEWIKVQTVQLNEPHESKEWKQDPFIIDVWDNDFEKLQPPMLTLSHPMDIMAKLYIGYLEGAGQMSAANRFNNLSISEKERILIVWMTKHVTIYYDNGDYSYVPIFDKPILIP